MFEEKGGVTFLEDYVFVITKRLVDFLKVFK